MSHAGRTGVDNMIRVLSIVVPLKADAPPSAVALLRDPVAELTERLGCVVNNAARFEHAVAVYRLRAVCAAAQPPHPVAVSLMVGGARHGAMSVAVVADLDVQMAMVVQRAHQYWCWQLQALLEVAWGPPTENHHGAVRVPAPGHDALARALAARSAVPHCGALPWYQVECGPTGCWIQAGEITTRPPTDVRGVIVRGGCRAELGRAVQQLVELVGAERALVVAPSPVLRQWWQAALGGDPRFVTRVAHDMLGGEHLSETWPVVVWDAVQPFPLGCAALRPTVAFSVVLGKPQGGMNATRFEHTLCRLLGFTAAQVQGMLVPPASCVVHRGDPGVQLQAVHACTVQLPTDLRRLVDDLCRPDVHMGAVVDNAPFVAANLGRQCAMFGTALSAVAAPTADKALRCPMCEIEDACGDWPLLKLVGCAHAVCLKHARLWPDRCALCRAEIQHGVADMPVICRTGRQVVVAPGDGTVVMPRTIRDRLQAVVNRYWGGPTLTPKLARCATDAENRHRAGGAVVVVAAHDAAVVRVADELGRRGVPTRTWLGVADAAPGRPDDGTRFVLCLAQRMVCCAARLAWVVPGAADAVPHAICASGTVPVHSLVQMLGGCQPGGTIAYVVHGDTAEARDVQQRLDEFRHACPELGGRVQVHGADGWAGAV